MGVTAGDCQRLHRCVMEDIPASCFHVLRVWEDNVLMFLFPEKTLCEQKSSNLFINSRSKLAPAYSEPWMNHRKFGACPVFTFDFMFRSSSPFLKINPLPSFPPEVSFSVFSC